MSQGSSRTPRLACHHTLYCPALPCYVLPPHMQYRNLPEGKKSNDAPVAYDILYPEPPLSRRSAAGSFQLVPRPLQMSAMSPCSPKGLLTPLMPRTCSACSFPFLSNLWSLQMPAVRPCSPKKVLAHALHGPCLLRLQPSGPLPRLPLGAEE